MSRFEPAGRGLFSPTQKSGDLTGSFLALLAGAFQAACVAWPWPAKDGLLVFGLAQGLPLWWGQLLAMTVLVVLLLDSRSARQCAWRGWLFASSWLAMSVGWLYAVSYTHLDVYKRQLCSRERCTVRPKKMLRYLSRPAIALGRGRSQRTVSPAHVLFRSPLVPVLAYC